MPSGATLCSHCPPRLASAPTGLNSFFYFCRQVDRHRLSALPCAGVTPEVSCRLLACVWVWCCCWLRFLWTLLGLHPCLNRACLVFPMAACCARLANPTRCAAFRLLLLSPSPFSLLFPSLSPLLLPLLLPSLLPFLLFLLRFLFFAPLGFPPSFFSPLPFVSLPFSFSPFLSPPLPFPSPFFLFSPFSLSLLSLSFSLFLSSLFPLFSPPSLLSLFLLFSPLSSPSSLSLARGLNSFAFFLDLRPCRSEQLTGPCAALLSN